MTRLVRSFVASASLAFAIGASASCAAPPNERGVPFASSSFADFYVLGVKSETSLDGKALDVVDVKPNEVIRIETDSAKLHVGEREGSGAHAEIWHDENVTSGVLVLRAGVMTHAFLFPQGTVSHAWQARPFEPGYYWFEHDDRVLTWAEGPLDAKFPPIASPSRVDYAAFDKLDQSLTRAVSQGASAASVDAIRAIAGLRALNALRPVQGFPYALDTLAITSGKGKTIEVENRELRRVSSNEPVELEVLGPGTLHIWARAEHDESDEIADLHVLEGDRERAVGGGTVLRHRLTTYDPSGAESKEALASLRRAIVFVPPGPHKYRVEARSGSAFVFGIETLPIEHIEDVLSHSRDETKLIAVAKEACGIGKPNAACAYALALNAEDHGDEWQNATAKLDDGDRALAEMLAAGGPRDPTQALELRGSSGDATALTSLVHALSADIDEGVRGAYERAVARGTAWDVIEPEGVQWTIARLDPKDKGKCGGVADFTELTDAESVIHANLTHEKHIISLVVDAPCSDKRPVMLEVDGQKIRLAPLHPSSVVHLAVPGETARVRVTDAAGAHIRVVVGSPEAGCDVDVLTVRGARIAKTAPTFQFEKEQAPGIEVWLRDDAKSDTVNVTSTTDATHTVQIVAGKSSSGLVAIDEDGRRWTRSERVFLPTWAASSSVRANGSEKIAVRAIARVARFVNKEVVPTKVELPETLEEATLVEESRAILHATKADRGALYLARAMTLAKGGAEHAALEDAHAAQSFGVTDALERVRAAIRRRPITAGRVTRTAYGLEPDFDAKAVRCAPMESPRTKLAALEHEANTRGRASFSGDFAVRVAEVASELPGDPRAEHLLARASIRGRWKTNRDADGGQRVARPDERTRGGVLDADQELRAHVIAGAPFGAEDFAAVTHDHPARAALAHVGVAHLKVDFLCIARAPWDEKGPCPFEVALPNGKTLHANDLKDGRGSIDVPRLEKGALELRLTSDDAKWTALARLGFDRDLPGTHQVDGLWVLEVPHLQYRYLVHAGQTLSAKVKGPTLVRVDALIDGEEPTTLSIAVDGKEEALPLSESKVFATRLGNVSIRVKTGNATIQIAERVPIENGEDTASQENANGSQKTDKKDKPADTSVAIDAASGPFKDMVQKSPEPLSTFQSLLPTAAVQMSYVGGTLREGAPASTDFDQYATAIVELRRRIEAIDLTATLGGVYRYRTTNPTEGGYLILYEDQGSTRLRATGTLVAYTQNISGTNIATVRPKGFLEYSARLGQEFFILPRIGFDGFYTNAGKFPANESNIDDDVLNIYRSTRNAFGFLQALVWWEPSFNMIFYSRSRGTWDFTNGEFNHVAERPGILSVFGQLEVDAYFDAAFYPKSTTDPTAFIPSAGLNVDYNGWVLPGSFALLPLVQATSRFDGGGYQIVGGLQVVASARRGLRDFSSLELSFPEQTAGGIPWRGEGR